MRRFFENHPLIAFIAASSAAYILLIVPLVIALAALGLSGSAIATIVDAALGYIPAGIGIWILARAFRSELKKTPRRILWLVIYGFVLLNLAYACIAQTVSFFF